MFKVPKLTRYCNEDYLNFIRCRNCQVCGKIGPSEPHHVSLGYGDKGWGTKVPDTQTISVCRECHDSLQSEAGIDRMLLIPAIIKNHMDYVFPRCMFYDRHDYWLRLATLGNEFIQEHFPGD